MYTSWWRCFFQNLIEMPILAVYGLGSFCMLVLMALVVAGVIH
jgi:hypothetical protein